MYKIFYYLLFILLITSCDRSDPEVNAQSENLQGRWNLVSVVAQGHKTKPDTNWVYSNGFIEFKKKSNKELGPITYSIAEGDIMTITSSSTYPKIIIFNTPFPGDSAKAKVGLVYDHKIEVLTEKQLVLSGTLFIEDANNEKVYYAISKIEFTK
jgi:hypothetical protein